MVDRVVIALAFSLISLAFLVAAYASPYWIESFQRADSVFIKAGIWEFCFNDFTFWKDFNGNRYKGCWYTFKKAMKPIWYWLNPHWLILVQVLSSLAILFYGITIIFIVLAVCHVFSENRMEMIIFGSSIVEFVIVIMQIISLTLYGIKRGGRGWLPRPDQNFLSWAYGLYFVSAIFTLAGAITLFKAGMKIRKKLKEDFPNRRHV
ncbi:uncharacterized protein [Argopecten irradians]|uniref:uncharacterized protein n=1 Tax=Argopecten irradians TaxID=31199 RepID=UPI00370FEC41